MSKPKQNRLTEEQMQELEGHLVHIAAVLPYMRDLLQTIPEYPDRTQGHIVAALLVTAIAVQLERMPTDEDLLLMLCSHGNIIQAVVDVAESIRQAELRRN